MKELYASADAGMIGLLFFFAIFVGIAIWLYQPHRKQSIEKLSHIPFNEDNHD